MNIKETNVTMRQIEIAAPVLKIVHFGGDDPPFIPATLIPAIVVPVGLGGGGKPIQPKPTQAKTKPSGLRPCAQGKVLNLAWQAEKQLKKVEFEREFRVVKYAIYSRGNISSRGTSDFYQQVKSHLFLPAYH